MNTEPETSRTAEEKARNLRQEFSELPFDRKIATLMQLETVAATEAFDKIAKASAALGKKIFDNVMSNDAAQSDERTPPEKGKPV
jgi:cytochrome c peroxidase